MTSPWLYRPAPKTSPRRRLFCFPYAGGAAHLFRPWPETLPGDVELVAIQLPGRGTRFTEAPWDDLGAIVEAVKREIEPALDRPFAFFGHSFGALLAFELCHSLREQSLPQPAHLFVSACRAPHIPIGRQPIYALEEADFLVALRELGGTPAEILENNDLMAVWEPALRADLKQAELYTYRPRPALAMRITGFCGMQDSSVPISDMEPWADHTTEAFILYPVEGDHFFIHSAQQVLIDFIVKYFNIIH